MNKIIFTGTPELAARVLERLIDSETWTPELVIAQPDKPAGRGHALTSPPVATLARRHEINVWQPGTLKDPAVVANIRAQKPDCIIVAAYGKLIPKEILDIPPKGVLNIHPSLLPRWRGPSPVASAILEGDKETGVTVMLLDEGMDSGPILSQKTLPVNDSDTTPILSEKLFALGAEMLLDLLPRWFAGNIAPKAQDETNITTSRLLKKEDGRVTIEYGAERIKRMVRAFDPWPGTYLALAPDKTVKLLRVNIAACEKDAAPLAFSMTFKKELCLHTKNGCLILESVQPEGKKPMSGREFASGHGRGLALPH